jgi:outer membrane autotransporter protein
VGIGLAYQKRSNDDFQFRYKKDDKPLPPISVPNEAKFEKPVFVSLRAGVEGKIYRNLSWTVDVNAQRGATNRQTLMSHLGLKYAF